jgi:hypothetical protein
MARLRKSSDPGPFSVRLPAELRRELEQWAAADMRSLHSLILVILRDALAAQRQAAPGSESAASDAPSLPAG